MYVLMAPPKDLMAPTSEITGCCSQLSVLSHPSGLSGFRGGWSMIVLGRELFMTMFRQLAARRGVVIARHRSGKVEDRISIGMGRLSLLLVFRGDAGGERGMGQRSMDGFAWFNALVGIVTMIAAVFLTLYSLYLYMRRYGSVLARRVSFVQ